MDLGRVWGGIWEDLDVFVQVVGKFWGHLEKCGPAAAKLINWTPALIREASHCAGIPPQRGQTELLLGL